MPRLAEVFVLREAAPGAGDLRKAALDGLRKPSVDVQPLKVYSDWLLERGDPSGELIASVVDGVPDALRALDALEDRCRELDVDLKEVDGNGYATMVVRHLRQNLEALSDALLELLAPPPGMKKARVDALVQKLRMEVGQVLVASRKKVYYADNQRGDGSSHTYTRESWQDTHGGTNLGPLADPEAAELEGEFVDRVQEAAKKLRWGG